MKVVTVVLPMSILEHPVLKLVVRLEVRKILEDSGRVLAVFQGHNHVNDHKVIGGVHYVTLAALIEGALAKGNNAWSVLEVYPGGVLKVDGFHHQEDYSLAAD